MNLPALWPHQTRAIADIEDAINRGVRRILVTSPTGGGKSRIMGDAGRFADHRGVTLYSVRRMLTEQLYAGCVDRGTNVGVRAAGYDEWRDIYASTQITSIQTEWKRRDSEHWDLTAPAIFMVDEAHLQKGESAQTIFADHLDNGATQIGFTATPLGVSEMYDELIVAGTNSELRRTGAHVPCLVFAPSEIDTSQIKKVKVGEDFTSGQIKSVWSQAIYGNVIGHHLNLNPDLKPALLMAPGVQEAVYFANEYEKRGIPAAAVDGKEIWFRGERMPSNHENRQTVNDALKSGEIKVICNRFVYREAVDIPELYHLILATPIGSVLSYIQSVGRVLRNHPSLDHVIVQDHGGNWYRHGSPNEDRDWQTFWKLDPTLMTKQRAEAFQDYKVDPELGEPEPICCPNCHAMRSRGIECFNCGHQSKRSMRVVIQRDGTLREKTGDVYRKRRIADDRMVSVWKQCVFRCKNSGRTFAQAQGLFAYENYGMYPSKSWPFMPKNRLDFHRKIEDVPREDLR